MRRLYLFILLSILTYFPANSQTVSLKQIGKENLLFNIKGLCPLNGMIYTVDFDGTVNSTTLDSGIHTRLSKTTYSRGEMFFGLNSKLYIIESNGSLNEINPYNGSWKQLTAMNVWTKIEQIAVVRNTLYTIENGVLYKHRSMDVDDRKAIGDPQFYNVGILISYAPSFYSLFRDGSFYEIDPNSGEWRKIGKGKSWKNLETGDVLGDKFYSVDLNGNFCETLLSDGTKKTIDATQFKKVRFLFEQSGKLYAIMKDGNLNEVVIN